MSSEGVERGVAAYILESVPNQSLGLVRDGQDFTLKGNWLSIRCTLGFGIVTV